MRKQFIKASALLIATVIVALTGCDTAFASGTLTLPASLKAIEAEAFYGDTNLEDVALPENLESIGSLAFANSSIKSINLPASITYIAEDAFRNCDGMTATVLPNSYAYRYCLDHHINYICEGKSAYRALLVGERTFLDWYMDEDDEVHYSLEYADRNAGDINKMTEMLGKVYGNDGIGKFAVTSKTDLSYSGIESAVQSTFAGTTEDDVSLFFIATHGNSSGDGELQMPFLGDPENEEERWEYYDHYLLSFSTLASWLTKYVKGEVIVIIESCGAGSAIYTEETEYEQNSVTLICKGNDSGKEVDIAKAAVQAFGKADPGIKVPETDAGSGMIAKSTGDLRIPKFYVLACSRHRELSWGNMNYNYFTHWLIEGIGSSNNSPADSSPQDQALTLTELFNYIKQYDNVPFTTYENGQMITVYQHVQRYPVNSQFQLFRLE